MRIDFLEGHVTGLPPAYASSEEIVRAYALMFEEHSRLGEILDMDTIPEGALDFAALEANSEQWDIYIPKFLAAFATAFGEEVKAGNFEIFEAEGFLGLILDTRAHPLVKDFFRDSPAAVEKLAMLVEQEISFITNLAKGYYNFLSTSQVQRLWEAFKLDLEEKIPNWSTSEMIRTKNKSADRSIFDKNHLVIGLMVFGDALDISESIFQEVMALSWDKVQLHIIQARRGPSRRDRFSMQLKIEDYPRAFKKLEPEAFSRKVQESGADPDVVELLLPEWTEDLGSLLGSASLLSADQLLSI